MRYIFIVNPISGGKSKAKLIQYLNEFCFSNHLDFTVRYTEYAEHAKAISKEYAHLPDTVLVAVGGDGTVNEVASSLVGCPAILYVIPCGSGNGFARHNQIPLDYVKNLNQLLKSNHVKHIDSCSLNGIPFFNVSGVGFDAFISQKFSLLHGRGFINYLKAIVYHYRSYKNQDYLIKLADEEIRLQAFFISFANTTQFGNNAHIAPTASNTDGLLDVVVVRKMPFYLFPIIIYNLFNKRAVRSKYINYYKTQSVSLECTEGCIHIDGEPILECYSKIEVHVKPLSLKLLCP